METLGAVAYYDGLILPKNPGGLACGGWYVPRQPQHAIHVTIQGDRYYGQGDGWTNNVAEYMAAADALLALRDLGYTGLVELRGDSELVTKQFSGVYGCKSLRLCELLQALQDEAAMFERVDVVWVPRTRNQMADCLSRKAYNDAKARIAQIVEVHGCYEG